MKGKSGFALTSLCLLLSLVVLAGSAMAATVYTVSTAGGPAPIAENIQLNTYKDVPVCGEFSAFDPDGGALTFKLTSEPKKGSVGITGDSSFTYTPFTGKKGSDSFTYAAVDEDGNVSGDATVSIKISKQKTKITYSDMDGSSALYAALVLAENGVFSGAQIGGEYFFSPDEPVTRGEFLAMCMQIAGVDLLDGVTRTGFFDDDAIPGWCKPYISTALVMDTIRGYTDDEGHIVFSPNRNITFSEASVMLNNIMNITDVKSAAAVSASDTPVWAYQAVANLHACSILTSVGSDVYSRTVTRADAALMLAAAIDVMNNR